MRILLCLLFCCTSLACARPANTTAVEHTAESGSHGYMDATVYSLCAGTLTETQKRLPWQTDMEGYALSFVLDDPAVQYEIKKQNGLATADIASFPAWDNAALEAAAVAGVVNTLLAFPDVESVLLTFDGKPIPALPHGTATDAAFSAPIRMDANE